MTTSVPRFRFLPITIIAAVLMLTVKVNDLREGLSAIAFGGVTVAGAQERAPGAKAPAGAATSPSHNAAPGQAPAAMPTQTAEAAPGAAMSKEKLGQHLLGGDPTLLTQSEIDILQKLADRREALDARAQEIDRREGLLKAAEARIDHKVAELQTLQKTIESRIRTYDSQQDAKMNSLVKIYENMKPKDAARIFEELDMDTLLMVAERMKERKLAPIMSNMDPAKAKEMTVELARSRDLPPSGSKVKG